MKKIFFCFGMILTVLTTDITASIAQEKKKISSQGKGAIIGGAGGAIAGGLIGHGVKGALIGGAIGAGGGYIIGNETRKNKEKKRRAAQRAYWRSHHKVTHPSKGVTVIKKY